MKAAVVAIEPWIVDVLSRSVIDGRLVKLNRQLGRREYTQINDVLEGMGGKWNRRHGGHLFDFDPSGVINTAIADGSFVHRQKTLQMFETPEPLALRMIERAGIAPGMEVLEPSAGLGRLCIAAMSAGAKVGAVEIDPINAAKLGEIEGLQVWHADFLRWAAAHQAKRFDAVVMNPPFTGGQDIAHVTAAWPLVKAGGMLVAILSEGAFTNAAWQARAFRDWLAREVEVRVERLEAGTFRQSGTDVRSRLIAVRRT